jgi:hypothetical protein
MPTAAGPRALAAVARWRAGLRTGGLVPVAVCGLILLPLGFTGLPPKGFARGAPRLALGDEPHYLVLINSLLNDGDLDLANNYQSVHRGEPDAGRHWQGYKALDHHTTYRATDGGRCVWQNCYAHGSTPFEKWATDDAGRLLPGTNPGCPPAPSGAPEYSYHQPGVAFLLAPVLWPFRGTDYLESAALAMSGLATVGGYLAFRWMLLGFGGPRWQAEAAAAAAFLATPVWFYGRSLFLEGFLVGLVSAAYALAVRQRAVIVPAVLLAVAVQLKAYMLMMAVPLAVDLLVRREGRRLVGFAAVLAVGVLAVLAQNWYFFGHPLTPPQPFVWGTFRRGAVGQLLNPKAGLLWVSPLAVAAVLCWPHFLRTLPRAAGMLLAGAAINYLFFCNLSFWDGSCYGPRYLVPVLPLVFAALAAPRPDPFAHRWLGVAGVGVLAAVSVAANGSAACSHWRYHLTNPVVEWLGGAKEAKATPG